MRSPARHRAEARTRAGASAGSAPRREAPSSAGLGARRSRGARPTRRGAAPARCARRAPPAALGSWHAPGRARASTPPGTRPRGCAWPRSGSVHAGRGGSSRCWSDACRRRGRGLGLLWWARLGTWSQAAVAVEFLALDLAKSTICLLRANFRARRPQESRQCAAVLRTGFLWYTSSTKVEQDFGNGETHKSETCYIRDSRQNPSLVKFGVSGLESSLLAFIGYVIFNIDVLV